MLAIVLTCVVLVAGLVFYAMHRSKPSRLKLSATLLKLVSFSIEVESDDHHRGELPPLSGDGSPNESPDG